jgi:hypothetical protein
MAGRSPPKAERFPMTGERVRADDGFVGVVVLVLPGRGLVLVEDDSGMHHEIPLEGVSVVDGDRYRQKMGSYGT